MAQCPECPESYDKTCMERWQIWQIPHLCKRRPLIQSMLFTDQRWRHSTDWISSTVESEQHGVEDHFKYWQNHSVRKNSYKWTIRLRKNTNRLFQFFMKRWLHNKDILHFQSWNLHWEIWGPQFSSVKFSTFSCK